MFGIKNPAKMLGMLKMFGVKPDQLIMQLEELALKKWKELEAEAGSELTAVAVLDDTDTHFIACLYTTNADGSLELWRSFPLKNINQFLQNIERNDTAEYQDKPTPAIGTGNNAITGNEHNPGNAGNGFTE